VLTASGRVTLRELPRFPDAAGEEVAGATLSPMPGAVVTVAVEEGQAVTKGDLLVTVEAMKMEHRVTAPSTAPVAEVRVDAPASRSTPTRSSTSWSSRLVDHRPWGGFRQYTRNQTTTVKLIEVAPGQRLSLQRHTHRDELWVVLDDGLEVRIGDRTVTAARGDEFLIPRGTLHRVAAGPTGGRFVEVCFGYFDEDDIERLEDAYGRS
jgi:mannose-6-phosphate isomerase